MTIEQQEKLREDRRKFCGPLSPVSAVTGFPFWLSCCNSCERLRDLQWPCKVTKPLMVCDPNLDSKSMLKFVLQHGALRARTLCKFINRRHHHFHPNHCHRRVLNLDTPAIYLQTQYRVNIPIHSHMSSVPTFKSYLLQSHK